MEDWLKCLERFKFADTVAGNRIGLNTTTKVDVNITMTTGDKRRPVG